MDSGGWGVSCCSKLCCEMECLGWSSRILCLFCSVSYLLKQKNSDLGRCSSFVVPFLPWTMCFIRFANCVLGCVDNMRDYATIKTWRAIRRYLISYLHFLLYFRGRKLQNNGSISRFLELSSIINFLTGDLLTFYSPFYALLLLQIGAQCAAEAYRSRGRAASSFPAPTKKDALLHIKYSR